MSICLRSLLLVLLIIFYLQSCTVGQYQWGRGCCFHFYKRQIRPSYIMMYERTRSDCSKPGVMLISKRGMSVCVDPSLKWVQLLMDMIDLGHMESSSECNTDTRNFRPDTNMQEWLIFKGTMEVLGDSVDIFIENIYLFFKDILKEYSGLTFFGQVVGDGADIFIKQMYSGITYTVKEHSGLLLFAVEQSGLTFIVEDARRSGQAFIMNILGESPHIGALKEVGYSVHALIKKTFSAITKIAGEGYSDDTDIALEDCCLSFCQSPIRFADVTKYEETNRNCPRAGVIFTLHDGGRACADPSSRKVQALMKIIDSQTAKN